MLQRSWNQLVIDDGPLEEVPQTPVNPDVSPRPRYAWTVSTDTLNAQAGPSSPRGSAAGSPTGRIHRKDFVKLKQQQQQVASKGMSETQKLLAHLLDKLESREAAPDLLARAAISARQVYGRGKGKGKNKVAQLGHAVAAAAHGSHSKRHHGHERHDSLSGIANQDMDELVVLDEGNMDTDEACELLDQLRSLLVLADRQNLDLFASEHRNFAVRPKKKGGRFSGMASSTSLPHFMEEEDRSTIGESIVTVSSQGLLDRLLAVLGSLIKIDCLHRTVQFRPKRPPFALHALCLDIATYLYHHCGTKAQIEVVDMVISGLYTMGETMEERVCQWLEGRVEELLHRLAKERQGGNHVGPSSWHDSFAQPQNGIGLIPGSEPTAPDADRQRSASSGWMRYSPTSPTFTFDPSDGISGLLSTHAVSTDISPRTAHLSALVAHLLSALCSNVESMSRKLTRIHALHRLLSIILTSKPDSCLDLLEIAGHATPRARRSAVEILSTFFPQVIGHNAIARRCPSTTYAAQRTRWETGQEKVLGEDATEGHHYIPWRITSQEGYAETPNVCVTCQGDIHGFCVMCTLCHDRQHLHCLSHPDTVLRYHIGRPDAWDSASGIHVKFSLCLPLLDEHLSIAADSIGTLDSTRRRVGNHVFHLVNLFTVTVCERCQLPLWGLSAQAYVCLNDCQRFYHSKCVDSLASEGGVVWCEYGQKVGAGQLAFSTSLVALQSSWKPHAESLCLPSSQLADLGYDEVAVIYGALWTQYQLLENGLAGKSIQVVDNVKSETDILQLRPYLRTYEEYLERHESKASTAILDFANISNTDQLLGQGYLFSERFLAYCAALLRSPSEEEDERPLQTVSTGGLLSAQGVSPEPSCGTKPQTTYETLSLAMVQHALQGDFKIHSLKVASLLLDQLRVTGLITIAHEKRIDTKVLQEGRLCCSFGLPFLMDPSPTVELLIAAIEASLDDLDLTLNEVGLRLLSTLAWPSPLCSPYALERVGEAVVQWVTAQDTSLLAVVRAFASKNLRLPGVKASAKGTSSVQIYKDDRLAIQVRYASPWLEALHEHDADLYAHIVYDQCKSVSGLELPPDSTTEEVATVIAGTALEKMAIMSDAGLLFSAQLDLLTSWLEDLGTLATKDLVYRSLPRLLRATPRAPKRSDPMDIWTLSQMTMSEGQEGFARVCKWMRVLALSGVEVPWEIISTLIDQTSKMSSLQTRIDLVIAANSNTAKSDPGTFAKLCCRLFVDFADGHAGDAFAEQPDVALGLLRRSMLLVLRAYGVSPEDSSSTQLGADDRIMKQPPSLAKQRRLESAPTASLDMDEGLVLSLSSLLAQRLCPMDLLLDFLWLLFTKSTFASNVDGFIHKECSVLYPVLWDLISDESVDRRSRSRVFLRLLAVNSTPLDDLVKRQFHRGDRMQLRERLLKFVLELADDSLTHDNNGWRRASVGVVILFFESLLDPVDLIVMSGCFEEYLMGSSDEARLSLLSRLHRLRLLYPKWPVLSWSALEELLADAASGIAQMTSTQSPQAAAALADAQNVRANLVALGLDMLAAGIETRWETLQRFQEHVSGVCSPPWPKDSSIITSLVLPSVRSALDSSQHVNLGTHVYDTKFKKTSLVGALFVPAIIDLGRELDSYDYLTQRTILDLLMIVFFKQSTRTGELSAIGALQSVAEFVATAQCVENRLFAIQILQTAVGRMELDSLARITPTMFSIMSGVLVSEIENDGEMVVIDRSRELLRSIVKTFGHSRLFLQLFRHDTLNSKGEKDAYSLSKALRLVQPLESDSVTRTILEMVIDDLNYLIKRGRQTTEQVLAAFERFVSISEESISAEAAYEFGGFLTRLGKPLAEWDPQEFNPNPILRASAYVLRLAPLSGSTTLVHQISTLLHLCLSRYGIQTDTVSVLLKTTDRVSGVNAAENTVRTVLLNVSSSALHGQSIHPVALNTLLDFVNKRAFPQSNRIDEEISPKERRILGECAPGCVLILLRVHTSVSSGQQDPNLLLSIFQGASALLIRAEQAIPGIMGQNLAMMASEAAIVQISVFTFILLASLNMTLGPARKRLVGLYPVLARAASLCLRASGDMLAVSDVTGEGADNLSTVFTVFRVALLAVRDPIDPLNEQGMVVVGTDKGVEDLWTRIWPSWYRLLSLSVDKTCVNSPLRSVAHTVFLDVLIFLGSISSPILSDHTSSLGHTLRLLQRFQSGESHVDATPANGGGSGAGSSAGLAAEVRSLQTGASSTKVGLAKSKMSRAEEALRQVGVGPPILDTPTIVKIINADLLAAERLRALRNTQSSR